VNRPLFSTHPGRGGPWRRQLRVLLLAWVALLALMLSSLGVAYLPIGAGVKATIGLGIAGVKALIIAIVFMQLGRGHVLVRVVAAVGLAALLVMGVLSATDYATRSTEDAAVQVPRTVSPGVGR
jgi:cytochrome c oxidase subunit 4